jgi:hypothetical protein
MLLTAMALLVLVAVVAAAVLPLTLGKQLFTTIDTRLIFVFARPTYVYQQSYQCNMMHVKSRSARQLCLADSLALLSLACVCCTVLRDSV